jgi:hypothetical protein
MARNGKIARLSVHIRNELNGRLQDGEPGTNLVEWLNGQPAVRASLKEYFGGVLISLQNLSEWRQGGYKDWLRLEAARDFIENMSEQSGVLNNASGEEMISDCFGTVLAAEMAQLAMKFLEQENDLEKRWDRLKEINREFSRMRRDDHRALRTGLQQAQWERRQERDDEAAEENMRYQDGVASLLGAIRSPAPAKHQPAVGQKPRIHHAEDEQAGPAGHGPAVRNQDKSDPLPQGYGAASQIKPNPTKNVEQSEPDEPPKNKKMVKRSPSSQPSPPGEGETLAASGHEPTSGEEVNTGSILKNRGKSNQIKVNQTKLVKPGLPSDTIKGKPGVPSKVEGPVFNFERTRLEEFVPEEARSRSEAVGVGRETDE